MFLNPHVSSMDKQMNIYKLHSNFKPQNINALTMWKHPLIMRPIYKINCTLNSYYVPHSMSFYSNLTVEDKAYAKRAPVHRRPGTLASSSMRSQPYIIWKGNGRFDRWTKLDIPTSYLNEFKIRVCTKINLIDLWNFNIFSLVCVV